MASLDIIFAGSGEFGGPTLRRLIEAQRFRIVQVVTQPDRPSGRGLKLTPTAIAAIAAQHQLPLLRTANINTEKLPPADVMVVIAFGQKVSPQIVAHPRLGSINLHASILPKYRGAAPINWAIINGESITGNSVIRLAEKMDAGAILAQSQIDIGELETAGEVHDRLSDDGPALIERVLDQLADGTVREIEQDHAQATLAPKLRREHASIDWTAPASSIACQIRGMFPWPGCRVRLMDGNQEISRLTLVRARAARARAGAGELAADLPADLPAESPGQITASGAVSAGRGAVEIVELQPEGKRPMSLEAFRNGHRWEAGMQLESLTS